LPDRTTLPQQYEQIVSVTRRQLPKRVTAIVEVIVVLDGNRQSCTNNGVPVDIDSERATATSRGFSSTPTAPSPAA
jgi:hypothetical protein